MRVIAALLAIPYAVSAFLSGWASLYLLTGPALSGQVEIQGINYRLPWAPLMTVALLLGVGVMAVVAIRPHGAPKRR